MTIARTEEEILQLARQRSRALVDKDAAAMDRLLADGFRYVNASGMLLTKTEYVQGYVEAPEARWTLQDMQEPVVQCYGDTAVLTCRVHDQGRWGAQAFDAEYRSVFVWVRERGEWRCVLGQTTAIAAAE